MLEHVDRVVAQIILKLKSVGSWCWWIASAAPVAATRKEVRGVGLRVG